MREVLRRDRGGDWRPSRGTAPPFGHLLSVHDQGQWEAWLGDVLHNVHRMDYLTYIQNGWPFGSGVIESACKRVIAKRLNGPGMRWREPGTHSLAYARSLDLSSDHRRQFFWSHLSTG